MDEFEIPENILVRISKPGYICSYSENILPNKYKNLDKYLCYARFPRNCVQYF